LLLRGAKRPMHSSPHDWRAYIPAVSSMAASVEDAIANKVELTGPFLSVGKLPKLNAKTKSLKG